MNILWITNILFPEATALLSGKSELKETGGWMLGLAESLISRDGIALSVASMSSIVNEVKILHGKNITYYILPMGKGRDSYNSNYEKYWIEIKNKAHPDIIHIHGTEYTHGLAYIKACGKKNVVVSIQGMKSIIERYYTCGLHDKEISRFNTLHDIITGGILSQKKGFVETGKFEKELLCDVDHIIGRTSWDRSHVWAINPRAKYHFCNEILRPEFYNGEYWSYNKCIRHSIFLSQGNLPIKGIHQVLKALPYVLLFYPDTIVRIAGTNITKKSSLKDYLHFGSYGKLINKIIRDLKLERNVIFLGNLNADQMKKEYLNANLFICPSSIENSPNSLGEAQILGTPCVASYVGGVSDMMLGNEGNIYRYEEIEMLAYKIVEIFKNKDSQIDMRKQALDRHNPMKNTSEMINIYRKIIYE